MHVPKLLLQLGKVLGKRQEGIGSVLMQQDCLPLTCH